MDVTEGTPSSSTPAPILLNWKELTGALVLSQGAEAVIYEATLGGSRVIVKERFTKSYRHPALDEKINSKRVKEEARVLVRARQAGVDVPVLLLVDKANRLIYMEKVLGVTMKSWLYFKSVDESNVKRVMDSAEIMAEMEKVAVSEDELARRTGIAIAKLHKANIVHGDLTTSNLMLRKVDMSIAIIDFGLSYTSSMTEDRAVDLYVLERAFLSTHTEMTGHFQKILEAYSTFGFKDVLKKLDEVRMRGRKKISFG